MRVSPTIATLLEDLRLTAASFIVTIYGDVALPRGEVLWMGSLIGVCARVGISENLVRTAVSRLVAAGRLEGERIGRRSYYRLAHEAHAEFTDAAALLFDPPSPPPGWLVQVVPGLEEEAARPQRMARMGGDVWISPDHGQKPLPGAMALQALLLTAPEAVAGFWDLSDLERRYLAILQRFGPLDPQAMAPEEALIARLLLVHVYRGAILRDPHLPAAALPTAWPGGAAAALFRSLYAGLSPLAEACIATMVEGNDGPLPASTPLSDARLVALVAAGST